MNRIELGIWIFSYEIVYSQYKKYCRKRKPDNLDNYVKDNFEENLKKMQRYLKKYGFKGKFNKLEP